MSLMIEGTGQKRAASRVIGSVAAAVVLITASAVFALVIFPQWSLTQSVSLWPGVAHVIAFARIFGCGLLLFGALVGAIAFVRRRRPWGLAVRAMTVGTTALLLIAGVVLMVWPSAIRFGSERVTINSDPGLGESLTVAVYNSQNTLTGDDLEELDRLGSPGVDVLPEAAEPAARVAIAESGLPLEVVGTLDTGLAAVDPRGIAPTSILFRSDRTSFEQRTAPPTYFGSVAVTSPTTDVTILGVHTAPPRPHLMRAWRTDLDAIAAVVNAESAPTIIAGDFNATLRHGPLSDLRQYQDASLACDPAGVGTWPVTMPESLATPIDRVLVRKGLEVTGCSSMQIGQGDHRALITTISGHARPPS